jgi:hypothetical protein
MGKQRYWAIRPISQPTIIRIEKAETPKQACSLAFGRGVYPDTWEAKDMGTQLSVIQSDNKWLALLRDPANWIVIQ